MHQVAALKDSSPAVVKQSFLFSEEQIIIVQAQGVDVNPRLLPVERMSFQREEAWQDQCASLSCLSPTFPEPQERAQSCLLKPVPFTWAICLLASSFFTPATR